MIRIAYARHFDANVAVAQCIASLGDIQPKLLIVFCGGKHSPETILTGLRLAYGSPTIVGGSAAGVIGRDEFGYSGLELGILAFADAAMLPQAYGNSELLSGEQEAGLALGRQVAKASADGAIALLFFDSVARTSPLRLHSASAIVNGFQAGLGGRRLKLIGGGLLTDLNLSDGWIFDGSTMRKHAAVALVFPPGIAADTVVLHGCRPVSTFMEITRVEGAEVYELDGQPALPVIERMLGLSLGSQADRDLSLIATLGQKQGDLFAPFDENAYVNRLILTSDRSRGSVTLFEPDFAQGTKVQIMSRDNALMLDSVRKGVESANRLIEGEQNLFALYIDCAGRASAFSGAPTEEAEILLRNLDPSVPLLGFYSGVEVAPFEGYSRPLDWTGVLTIFRNHA